MKNLCTVSKMRRNFLGISLSLAFAIVGLSVCSTNSAADKIDLTHATVVSPFVGDDSPEEEALQLLVEEASKRTGFAWPVSRSWPENEVPVIVLTSKAPKTDWPVTFPERWEKKIGAEGYQLLVQNRRGHMPVVWAVGADTRGVLFASGGLLRALSMQRGDVSISSDLNIATSPAYPLRGHQLGYRAKANSYDAWTPADYEQYIRDLMVFGTNAIEQIPLEEPYSSPHFPIPRTEMNRELSAICEKYGIEYWMWMPVMEHREEGPDAVALSTEEEQDSILDSWRELFEICPRVDGVFVPSSDPGINKAELLMPFLEKAAKVLRRSHPHAKIWVSHQGLADEDQTYMYEWLEKNAPEWFGGIGFGPWTQTTFAETRTRLPKQYEIRSYPDITHTVRCQFPVIHWDRAFALTLGRECINPRPVAQKRIHNIFAPDTNGFITYSDGIHDDVNKIIWTAMGWNPEKDVRTVLTEYGEYFVRKDLGQGIADGLLALERNWDGPLATNGSVDATLQQWQALEERAPNEAEDNWRFIHGLIRAYYDAYTRHRLIHEQELEKQVTSQLANAGQVDPITRFRWDADHEMYRAESKLRQADLDPAMPEWREKVFYLAERLMETIGHQLSVERYGQLDYDRGTMLDTIDYPLNNRWWLEDQFVRIRELTGEAEKIAALKALAKYESPVPGTFYDDLGNINNSPRLARIQGATVDPVVRQTLDEKTQAWVPYLDRRRLSQQDGIGDYRHWTAAYDFELRYVSLDRNARYVFRARNYKTPLSKYAIFAEDIPLKPTGPPTSLDSIEEYKIPQRLTQDGALTIRCTVPEGVGVVVAETWLIPVKD